MRWIALLAAAMVSNGAFAADPTPRTAIISAFPPEWQALKAQVVDPQPSQINGVDFIAGTMAGKPVLLFLSGVSMINAAMTTQLALDNFAISRIVFSGVAGGIDPKLDVGDVVVANRWGQYLESVFARQTPTGFVPVERGDIAAKIANYGMIFPRQVSVRRKEHPQPEQRIWFDADPAMLAVAQNIAGSVTLKRCNATQCLVAQPKVVVGGNGISGPVFMDNAEFRQYAYKTFDAQVLDMESAAVAQVAYANDVPYIAFRSLSDLAGGDPGENQARIFYPLASDNSAMVVAAFMKALP